MNHHYQILQLYRSKIIVGASVLAVLLLIVLLFAGPAYANNQRAITIHDGEESVTVATTAGTVGEVLRRADIELEKHDGVEPSRDTPLLSPAYTVNIYRARPVTIADEDKQLEIMSPHRSSRSIVTGAGLKLHDEDIVSSNRVDNFVASGGVPGVKVTIDRSVSLTLVLYGKQTQVRTQAETVGELLKEKDITLGPKGGTSKPLGAPIVQGMALDVYRDGVRTKTVEESIPFGTRHIQDANREVGYRDVQEKGQNGRKTVTYEVTTKNGNPVNKKKIASVVTKQPKQQVIVVGAKPSFGGDFAGALAKLRSCEGGYDSINPAGPYYGAYQFDQRTWAGAAPPGAEYGNASPAEQDQAARNLYERRGWQPWPVCGSDLPDIYR